MAELYLVRHGQASFGSRDYDRLSERGVLQCQWLGEYFRQRGIEFDRIISGAPVRQQQSALAICARLDRHPPFETHAGFDEFDFQTLLRRYCDAYPDKAVHDWRDVREIYRCLREAMLAWAADRLPPSNAMESWAAFRQRVVDGLDFARRDSRGRTLVATSGGVISMALSVLMEFGDKTLVDLNLQIRNASITHCYYNAARTYVTGFNGVPHLDTPVRRADVTYC